MKSPLSKTSRINLRYRDIDNGKRAIYLDYYKYGKRIRESLNLYILPEVTKSAIAQNKRTMKLAEEIRKQRLEEITSFETEVCLTDKEIPLLQVIDEYEESYASKVAAHSLTNLRAVKKAVGAFAKNKMSISQVDADFCSGFIRFLSTYECSRGRIKTSTASAYAYIFSGILTYAVEHGYIGVNPFNFVKVNDVIPCAGPDKVFLTIDEVKRLMETPCPVLMRPQVKQAYLLAVFTGLSLSDITGLRWIDLTYNGSEVSTVFKRSRNVSVAIPDVARKYIPDTTNHRGLVYKGLPGLTEIRNILTQWAAKADIHKPVTFNVAKNCYANILLTAGVDTITFYTQMGIKPIKAKKYFDMAGIYPSNNNIKPITI